MIWLIGFTLLLSAVSGALVVFSRDPKRQVYAICANGLVLALLFFVLQAPDVAFSEIAVGTVIVPLLFLITLAAVAMHKKPQ
ncbi:MAG TPA: hydrogenase subunit MbhD domain-containing protein [Gammaproteobacteria bacterium]|nr:hydrogenase subunit MbhD domain-containing protein [Gammaproteobacteria bacterium]